jgi:hypothetical protein
VPPADPDLPLRQAAVARARQLAELYDDLVPLSRLREGFRFGGSRLSYGSFQRGIHRGREQLGPAALTLTTSFHDPYADTFDEAGALFTDDPAARVVVLEPGLPIQDMQPGGLISAPDVRAYATGEARVRLHQQRFKLEVMRAYRNRCAICSLRERALVQAAHIVPDADPEGIAAVVNGLALCAIHHLAFDRNLLGIDPGGVVHIADRLLREIDGPMLRTGLQGFHGESIVLPRRPEDRPDRLRLESRFERFLRAAA